MVTSAVETAEALVSAPAAVGGYLGCIVTGNELLFAFVSCAPEVAVPVVVNEPACVTATT